MRYWLVKQEPSDYSWDSFVKDGKAAWTGVRNFQARNNLRAMQREDRVLFYHSGADKCVVGMAKVAKTAYPDPTASEGDWSCVDLSPLKALARPVSLASIRGDKNLAQIPLVKHSRLSVSPLTKEQFEGILNLGETTPP